MRHCGLSGMRINRDKKREDRPSSYLVDAASWHHVSTPVIPFPDLLIVFYPTVRLIRACFENKRSACESVCGPFAEGESRGVIVRAMGRLMRTADYPILGWQRMARRRRNFPGCNEIRLIVSDEL